MRRREDSFGAGGGGSSAGGAAPAPWHGGREGSRVRIRGQGGGMEDMVKERDDDDEWETDEDVVGLGMRREVKPG